MTLDEAIRDKNRPLSVTPAEWMEYQKAKDADEEVLYDEEATRLLNEERAASVDEQASDGTDSDEPVLTADDRLEMGLEQMAIGCKMAIRALHELSRMEAGQTDRSRYDAIGNYIRNGVSPYLADAMRAYRR